VLALALALALAIISALEDTVRKLQVQNIEKDAIIKSQEDIIKKLTEQVNCLMKNTTSSSLSKPPLALEDISDTKFDEDSDDMVPKLSNILLLVMYFFHNTV